jgi:hypothetical protein
MIIPTEKEIAHARFLKGIRDYTVAATICNLIVLGVLFLYNLGR